MLQERSLNKGTNIAKNITPRIQTNSLLTEKGTVKSVQDHNWTKLILLIYLSVSAILIVRLLFSLAKVLLYYLNSEKEKKNGYTLVMVNKKTVPFSFFNWVFINKSVLNTDKLQIIAHEKIHAKQYHTIDLLFSELLVAAMWFNPFIWMFKKALQQVHEFLADEGVLNSGYNKLEYQSLLVNQVAEGRLVAVSSHFSYSLIKKRIIMMSKTKTHGQKKWKLLILVPILSLLFTGTACLNAQNDEYVVAVSPTKMNVLYMGVDNPVSIAVTGADYGKETATIDNGSITGKNGNYTVRVTKPGVVTISVKLGDKIVSEQKFRVKKIPDPRAIIRGNYGKTSFSKQELKDAGGIAVLLENFDFDIKFDVIEFVISAAIEGYEYEARANNSNFSKYQIELIDKLEEGQKFYVEGIMVKGPDGKERNLSPMIYKIK